MLPTARKAGPVIRHCPCSPGAISCGYHNLDLHQGCPYNCTYCILQVYLQDTSPLVFCHENDLGTELERWRSRPHLRLGTGELADSLALDPETGMARRILSLFRDFPDLVFEFKTKSTSIQALLKAPEVLPNVVVSWSLNPESLCRTEETGAPGLRARLEALAAVAARGYRVGVHFDPMVAVPEWRQWYPELAKEILRRVPEQRLAWWSLGALRFPPALRDIILARRNTRLFSGELVRGFDGKQRYFRFLREAMFREVLAVLRRRISPEIPVYLCMEDRWTWETVFSAPPPAEGEINRRLHAAALR